MAHYFPGIHIDAVEIDPDVTKVGRDLFDLRGRNITTHTADARPWLQAQHTKYDAILVDAYRQPYIPFYLATREFFDLVKERLAPGGTVAMNVGHPEGSENLEKVLAATLRASFGQQRVWRDPVDRTNTMLLGMTTDDDPAERLRTATVPAEVGKVATTTADRLSEGLHGGTVYTDDRAPVEWLIDASLAKVAE
jgi:spermidine synthase